MDRLDESYVVGSLLSNDPLEVQRILQEINLDMFEDDRNRRIMDTALKLLQNGVIPDIISVSSALEQSHQKSLVEYLVKTVEGTIYFRSNCDQVIKLLKNRLYIRNVQAAARDILQMSDEPMVDVEELQTKSELLLLDASNRADALEKKYSSALQGLDDVRDSIIDSWTNEGGMRGLTVGFNLIDQLVRGLRPGDFAILAGRPSVGKTAMALNILVRAIMRTDISALFFSLEMSKQQLQERLLYFSMGLNGEESRRQVDYSGFAPPSVIREGAKNLERVLQDRLFIDDTSLLNEAQLRTRVGRAIAEHGIKFVCIDYLQLMECSTRSENRQVAVANLSRAAKSIARDFKIPILCLSQLSRNAKDTSEPSLSDLRDSGAIEQDADQVFMMWAPEADKSHVAFKVAKCRNGRRGKIEFSFDAPCFYFSEIRIASEYD